MPDETPVTIALLFVLSCRLLDFWFRCDLVNHEGKQRANASSSLGEP